MSDQLPPKVIIFSGINYNSQFFSKIDGSLTYQQATGLFLTYPSAQGNETTNYDMTINGSLKTLSMISNTKTDVNTSLGASNTASLSINDTISTNSLLFLPNPLLGAYNPSTNAGDITLVAKGSVANTKTLSLTTWAINQNSAVKISPTSVLIGAGGATNTPTTSVLCDGTDITLSSNSNVNMNKPLIMTSSTLIDRQIQNIYYKMIDGTSGLYNGVINSNQGNFVYDNDTNNGQHQFFVNDGAGNQQNPLIISSTNFSITTNNMTMNTTNPPTCSASYALVPSNDSSNKIPTTAWVQTAVSGAVGKTYTFFYNTNQIVTIPNNCSAIDIVIIGAGGTAGATVDKVGGAFNTGGSGAGGNTGIANKIPLKTGKQLNLSFNSTSGTGFSQIIVDGSNLCQVYNGNAGTDATTTAVGLAGTANTTPSAFDTTYANWISLIGSAGSNGTTSPGIIGSAGVAKGTVFSSTTFATGSGQLYNKASSVNFPFPTSGRGLGGCWITFYINF